MKVYLRILVAVTISLVTATRLSAQTDSGSVLTLTYSDSKEINVEGQSENLNKTWTFYITPERISMNTYGDIYSSIGVSRQIFDFVNHTQAEMNLILKLAVMDTFNEAYYKKIEAEKKKRKYEIIESDEYREILGYRCRKYTIIEDLSWIHAPFGINLGRHKEVHWVTDELKIDPKMVKQSWPFIFETGRGVSLYIESFIGIGLFHSITRITEISKKTVARDVFEYPEGMVLLPYSRENLERVCGLR